MLKNVLSIKSVPVRKLFLKKRPRNSWLSIWISFFFSAPSKPSSYDYVLYIINIILHLRWKINRGMKNLFKKLIFSIYFFIKVHRDKWFNKLTIFRSWHYLKRYLFCERVINYMWTGDIRIIKANIAKVIWTM